MAGVMDDAAVENADAARPAPSLKKHKKLSWPMSWKQYHDPEARGSGQSPSDSSQPDYIRKFEEDINLGLQEISKNKFSLNNPMRKDWIDTTFKTLQDKYTRRRHPRRYPNEDPVPFKGSITYLAKALPNAPATDCVRCPTQPLVLGDLAAIRDSLDKAQAQMDSIEEPKLDDSSRSPLIRWIHLPANNMEWVKSVMSSAMATCRPVRDNSFLQHANWDLAAERVFEAKFWGNQCREIHHNPIFSREMEPFATCIKVRPEDRDASPSEDTVNVLVAFMPYLHWESIIAARYMKHVAEDVERQGPDVDSEAIRDMCQDEILLRRYLISGSLHPRRTLDQFHYPYLEDTRERDYDQVVERYAIRGHFNNDTYFDLEPPILMVDQCWVWVIGPDTVLTAFPRTWDCYDRHEDPIDLHKTLLTNIQARVHQHYLNSSSQFARFVIRISAINTLQPSKYFREHDKFLLYFRHAINELRQRKTKHLKSLWQSLQNVDTKEKLDNIANVRVEYRMLQEAQDIVEELQMIQQLLGYQDETMRQFEQAQRKFFKAEDLWDDQSMQRRQSKRVYILNRPANKARRTLVNGMCQNAEELNADIHKLLKLKQQQANISEADLIRELGEKASEQGTTIKLLTIVTIVFLPLSTLAAFFGINSKNLGSGSMELGIIFAYIFPISTMCVVLTLSISLSPGIQQFLLKILSAPVKFLWQNKGKRPSTDIHKEASGDSAGLRPPQEGDRGPNQVMTGLSYDSTVQEAYKRRSSTLHRQERTRPNISMRNLASLNSYPEQATSILRRNDDQPDSSDRRRSFRRRNSKMATTAQESLFMEDVASYSLSSSSDSLNDLSDVAEDGLVGYDRTLQSAGASRSRTRRRGKLPM